MRGLRDDDSYRRRPGDHMIVGQDLSGRREHNPGARRGCVLVGQVRVDDHDACTDRASRRSRCRVGGAAADREEGDQRGERATDVDAPHRLQRCRASAGNGRLGQPATRRCVPLVHQFVLSLADELISAAATKRELSAG